jgi:hypothetical protein
MKKIALIVILIFLIACKKEAVEKPDRLIDKEDMVNIMYDLALLNVIKYQYAAKLDNKYDKNELGYVYTKYNIDSAQFVQSNSYYAADYKGYKVMFDEIALKVDSNAKLLDSLIKLEAKKLPKKKKNTIKKDSLSKNESVQKRLEKGLKEETQGVLN